VTMPFEVFVGQAFQPDAHVAGVLAIHVGRTGWKPVVRTRSLKAGLQLRVTRMTRGFEVFSVPWRLCALA